MNRNLEIACGTLGVSIVVLAMKAGAYHVIGSVALYSDALEAAINVASAIGALVALWFAEQPAYVNVLHEHPEVEYIKVMAENALVLVTGLVIGCGAWLSWQNPHAPDAPFLGIAINGTAGLINLVWALMLVRCGRAQGSPTLVAIGSYLMMGILTSSAVLAGFALLPLMGWLWLDPAIATLVALNVLWTGYCMVREPISGLEGLS